MTSKYFIDNIAYSIIPTNNTVSSFIKNVNNIISSSNVIPSYTYTSSYLKNVNNITNSSNVIPSYTNSMTYILSKK